MIDVIPKFLTFRILTILSVTVFVRVSASAGDPCRTIATLPCGDNTTADSCRLVINELMIDPTPVAGLPDAEWIELYNGSNCPIRLKNWKLTVGSTTRTLPDSLAPPGKYLILCSSKNASDMSRFGSLVVLSSLPALRNSGNRVHLENDAATVVDEIGYSDLWYGDPAKKNGGWSLERIDPERDCGQQANWTASRHPSGGTPGTTNSVYALNPDHVKPHLLPVQVMPPNSLKLHFSEPMDTLFLKEAGNYRLPDGWGHPREVTVFDECNVTLTWKKNFNLNEDYLLILDNLTDLCGNSLVEKEIEFVWSRVEQGDVVINEILFNPRPGSVDFVEVYNCSAKKIDPGTLRLATRDENGELKNLSSLKSSQHDLFPGGYLAFTTDSDAIFSFYLTPQRQAVCQVASLPPFNNDEGIVVLLNDSLLVLDELHYSEEMHHPLLYNREGVSLERVNPSAPTQVNENWQSAASGAGFATPGFRNSQYQAEPVKKNVVIFEQTSFSPDHDGYNDELLIRYQTREPGWVAHCMVFDTSGRRICQLLTNTTLNTSGEITWNGEDENGQELPTGPYIVWLEIFDLKGNAERFRSAVVLTKRGN